MTTLLESCRIEPAPGAVAEHSLPFTFFDIIWSHFHPLRRLFFYEIPCSKAYFLETLLPKLKHSLSLALKHYYPLAGRLFYPLKTDIEKPIIRYVPGDSVSLTIFESTNDFENLVGNHPRDADIFYEFIPQTNMVDESNHKLLQLLSLQLTVFRGSGVCVGFANHHSLCDDTSFMAFINCWASINKLGGDLQLQCFPLFERSLVKDPVGVDSIFWNQVKERPLEIPSFPLPTNRVRATYVLSQTDLKKLKDLVHARNPGLVHVSSFVVTTAYIWSCLSKSLVLAGEESGKADDNEECVFFLFAVDSRARLDPPLPGNYFGNCLSHGLGEVRHGELVSDEGFLLAAKDIALEIQNKVNDKEKILKGVENWVTEISSLFIMNKRVFAVSGSAKVDLYSSADFGWGKARKLEMLSIDAEKYSVSLSKSRDFEGGLEVGLSLPKLIMDAFADIFRDSFKLL